MAKVKAVFVCAKCQTESPKFAGQCPGCGEWATMEEQTKTVTKETKGRPTVNFQSQSMPAQPSPDVTMPEGLSPLAAKSKELNRVLGGGWFPTAFLLFGGEPGIGKTTLLLSEAVAKANEGYRVMYASAEESRYQVRSKLDRLGGQHPNLFLYDNNVIEDVLAEADRLDLRLLFVDSAHTMRSNDCDGQPGNPAQVRAVADMIMRWAKASGTTVALISHVNKDGDIAGPQILEHAVDGVFLFEADDMGEFRILRAKKNRLGTTDEVGFFEMTEGGLADIPDVSRRFVTQREEQVSGAAVAALVDGSRAYLVELQALVTASSFGNPRRIAMGVELSRLHSLLAVIEKRITLPLSKADAVAKVTGGLKLTDPAIDLALCAAIVSSGRDIPIPDRLLMLGEVNLSGEIGRVARIERRIEEAARMGYRRAIVPKGSYKVSGKIELIQVRTLYEALDRAGLLITRETAASA